MNKDIAIAVENIIQFQTIKNGIDELLKRNYTVDLYVPEIKNDEGYEEIHDSVYKYMLDRGYESKRVADKNIRYKILLQAHPLDHCLDINFEYRIKFKYGILLAKPDPEYKPEYNMLFDAILCYGKYEADILSAYTKTYAIGNMKYVNYEKKTTSEKPVLLYLPTWGDISSIDTVIDSIKKLKDKYKVIAKFHHGTSFLKNEEDRLAMLKEVVDEYYDLNTELVELLSASDVVLSDNSGAIFEAIYADVPVAIFTNDLNKRKLEEFDTYQYEFAQKGIIPHTKDATKIGDVLKDAMSQEYTDKQRTLKNELFLVKSDLVEDFVNIIDLYLKDKINKRNKILHDILAKEYTLKTREILEKNHMLDVLNNEKIKREKDINELIVKYEETSNILEKLKDELEEKKNQAVAKDEEIQILNKQIEYFETGKLYKLSKKIYKLFGN
ncbi:MAG: CDP-glycerol glycerophosphotransferase family protein [Oscillospiraceae bacterium]|nr:CDP-glycerol glycerophosphotransferase family protein [Oscillospiraceae bacterium]